MKNTKVFAHLFPFLTRYGKLILLSIRYATLLKDSDRMRLMLILLSIKLLRSKDGTSKICILADAVMVQSGRTDAIIQVKQRRKMSLPCLIPIDTKVVIGT